MTPAAIDQIFITIKHWLLHFVPGVAQPVASAILSVIPVMIAFPLLFAITTVLERKGLGRIQNRYGPNRVGPFGFLQPMADGIKSLTKEDLVPRNADHFVHFVAPVVMVIASFLGYAVLPIGRNMILANLNAGLLYFFAAGSMVELAVFMAGWSSHSKYSLLGAMRAVAQMISYEVPLVLASVVVIMVVGSLSTVDIVERAGHLRPHAGALVRVHAVGFCRIPALHDGCNCAESNRSPFDLPEGESEIIAGYFIEYSGFKFALFFLAEYLGMMATSALAITLFLGGWSAPFSFLGVHPVVDRGSSASCWFSFAPSSGYAAPCLRLRMDQLMGLAWKFMLPMTLWNLVVVGVWHFMAVGVVRWLVSAAMILIPWMLLGRGLRQEKKLQVRTYRFAE